MGPTVDTVIYYLYWKHRGIFRRVTVSEHIYKHSSSTFLAILTSQNMFSHPEAVVFLLCSGAYLYSVYYCVDKYWQDLSISNTR